MFRHAYLMYRFGPKLEGADGRIDIISVLEYESADNGGAGRLCKLVGR